MANYFFNGKFILFSGKFGFKFTVENTPINQNGKISTVVTMVIM